MVHSEALFRRGRMVNELILIIPTKRLWPLMQSFGADILNRITITKQVSCPASSNTGRAVPANGFALSEGRLIWQWPAAAIEAVLP